MSCNRHFCIARHSWPRQHSHWIRITHPRISSLSCCWLSLTLLIKMTDEPSAIDGRTPITLCITCVLGIALQKPYTNFLLQQHEMPDILLLFCRYVGILARHYHSYSNPIISPHSELPKFLFLQISLFADLNRIDDIRWKSDVIIFKRTWAPVEYLTMTMIFVRLFDLGQRYSEKKELC